MWTCLFALCVLIGPVLSSPLPNRNEPVAELKVLFDPSLHQGHIRRTDDYGLRPGPLPPPPDDLDLDYY